jgi:hypothetical protein
MRQMRADAPIELTNEERVALEKVRLALSGSDTSCSPWTTTRPACASTVTASAC